MKAKNFYIQVKGKKTYFDTIDAAQAVCQTVFEQTGIILGIIPANNK